MIFFVRGLKCGGLGAVGLADAPAAARNNLSSASTDASAMPPSPIAQRPKKWRRVSDCRAVISCGAFIFASLTRQVINRCNQFGLGLSVSFPSNGLIEIKQHPGNGCPGLVPVPFPVARPAVQFGREQLLQTLSFLRRGRARKAQAERVVEARGVSPGTFI